MDADLRNENAALRRQLDELIAEARRNEDKLRRFDRLERCLIGSQSLRDAVSVVLRDYRSAFDLDAVTLALVVGDDDVTRMLDTDALVSAPMNGFLRLDSAASLAALYRGGGDPQLSPYRPALHGALFGAEGGALTSVALLPLVVRGQLIGSLNLGSRAAQRFAPGCGTEFLERLAALVAVCLDSALNQERVKLMGLIDPLTGLGNRRYFERRCEESIAAARRHAAPLACLFLDIDRFKRINDTWGHPAGDEVLRRVAAVLRAEMRGSDVLARFGGEEFVALLPQTSLHQAMEIAERVRRAVAVRPFCTAAHPALAVTVSIGVAGLPQAAARQDRGALSDALVTAADRALYRAKQSGRNRVLCEAGLERPKRFLLSALVEALRRAASGGNKLRWILRRC